MTLDWLHAALPPLVHGSAYRLPSTGVSNSASWPQSRPTKVLALLQHALTAYELGLGTERDANGAELLAMLRRQGDVVGLLTCAFGALGGTRTPNLLIRSG